MCSSQIRPKSIKVILKLEKSNNNNNNQPTNQPISNGIRLTTRINNKSKL